MLIPDSTLLFITAANGRCYHVAAIASTDVEANADMADHEYLAVIQHDDNFIYMIDVADTGFKLKS